MFSTQLPRTGRREVLKLLGGGVAAGAGVGFWSGPAHADGEHYDCAVVGGGVAGLFTAWRLSQQGRRVALFEGSDRLGGRLLSVQLPGFTDQRAEVGGMRYTSGQRMVVAAVDRFIGAEGTRVFDYPLVFNYLRGRHLTPGTPAASLPYDLDFQERLMIDAGEDLLESTIRGDYEAAEAGDPALIRQGLWTYLLERRSNEGFNYILDQLGYHSIVWNWNAADAIAFLGRVFKPGQDFMFLRNGFEALPHAIAAEAQVEGAEIHLEHRLHQVDRDNDGLVTLRMDAPGGPVSVTADQVVLAMPQGSIALLNPQSFFFSDSRFRTAMNALIAESLAKIHLAFPTAWWEDMGIPIGKSISDLPIRQTYYWGREASGAGLMMASYHDGPSVDFWQGLTGGPRLGDAAWADQMLGPNGEPLAPSLVNSLPASEAMVDEVLRQLQESHGMSGTLPRPTAATYKNWGEAPYGGGWYRWKVGEVSADVISYLRRPFPDTGLHICGDAWSNGQGWVEGALETAEALLVNEFGMPVFAQN